MITVDVIQNLSILYINGSFYLYKNNKMKLNANIKLIGYKVVLVPYSKHHVEKYHIWMKSEELQRLTASEPLTLKEEYEMQKSWQEDEDKCTFIVLDKTAYARNNGEVDSMIGDTNIFIIDQNEKVGEIEIMIAEPTARGKKFGWDAVILMMLYGINNIHLKVYEAKINMANEASIQMFKKLKFEEYSRSDIFQEITFKKIVSDEWIKWLNAQAQFEIQSYDL